MNALLSYILEGFRYFEDFGNDGKLLYIALPVNEIQKGTCNFVGRIYVHIGTSHNGGEEMERFATFTQDAWRMLFIIDWSWKLEAGSWKLEA